MFQFVSFEKSPAILAMKESMTGDFVYYIYKV
jgi:hypothetical protein